MGCGLVDNAQHELKACRSTSMQCATIPQWLGDCRILIQIHCVCLFLAVFKYLCRFWRRSDATGIAKYFPSVRCEGYRFNSFTTLLLHALFCFSNFPVIPLLFRRNSFDQCTCKSSSMLRKGTRQTQLL